MIYSWLFTKEFCNDMTSNQWNNSQMKRGRDWEKRQNGDVGASESQDEGIVSGEILF